LARDEGEGLIAGAADDRTGSGPCAAVLRSRRADSAYRMAIIAVDAQTVHARSAGELDRALAATGGPDQGHSDQNPGPRRRHAWSVP
jgi:hypothetical protein